MKTTKMSKLALAIGTMAVAGAAWAVDTDSGSGALAVTAAITPECAVVQNTAIDFGNLSMLTGAAQSSTDSTGVGSVDAICTNGATLPKFKYTSANTAGANFRLIGTTDATVFIDYTVHQDATATLAAVTYDTATAYPGFVADGTAKTLAISTKILPADKNGKKIQAYSDTITVTTTFDA